MLVTGLTLVMLLQGEVIWLVSLGASPALPGWTSPGAISDVFVVTNVPTPRASLDGGVISSGVWPAEALHDDGLDALINLMATHSTAETQAVAEGIELIIDYPSKNHLPIILK